MRGNHRVGWWRGWLVAAALLPATVGQAVYEPALLPVPGRRWAVTLGLREEYDDNINTTTTGKVGSFNTIVEPQLLVNFPTERTFFGLRYTYDATYYSDPSRNGTVEQAHSGDLLFSHTFTPRLVLNLHDTVRRGIEPELVETIAGLPVVTQRRGDYTYNNGTGSLNYTLTPRWTTALQGGAELWQYDVTALATNNNRTTYQVGLSETYALDTRTSLGVGYQYQETDYEDPGPSAQRNSHSNVGYLTLARRFNPQLSWQANAGAEFREFGDGTTETGPSADTSLAYNYAPDSALSFGFHYAMTATEVAAFRSTDSAAFYLQANHRATRKFWINAHTAYSFSTFENPTPGEVDPNTGKPFAAGLTEQTLLATLGLRYEFTHWWNADAAYTYQRVWSDIVGRAFDRNQVSLGLHFVY